VATLSTINLRHIVDDTVMYYQMNSGGLSLIKKPFKMETIFKETEMIFKFETEGKDVILRVNSVTHIFNCIKYKSEKQEIVLTGDKMKIMHIVYTLVSNALKYTIKGSVVVDCTV